MNSAIVIFFKSIEKANEVVQSGVVLNGSLVPVLPLSSPSKKVILSNVPPFIKDEVLMQELSRYGKLVSPIKKIPLGCKSPLVKHLVSFRRQVFMVLKNGTDEIDLIFKFKIDGFDYTVFATSDITMKCFSCNKIGHLVRECPNRTESAGASTSAEQVVSAVSSAESAGNVESAGTTAEVTEEESGLVVADGIESSTRENVAKPCKSDTSELSDEQFEQSENICVADIEEMDVEGNVVDFETEVGSVFKIPVKRKKKAVERFLNK
ncbi:hypothetical protein PO909_030065 [Leuciscus waleckii]